MGVGMMSGSIRKDVVAAPYCGVVKSALVACTVWEKNWKHRVSVHAANLSRGFAGCHKNRRLRMSGIGYRAFIP